MGGGERIELESLRSVFETPGAQGTIREAGGAVAVRADGTPGRVLNRVIGLYDLGVLEGLAGIYAGRRFWISLDPAAGLDDELVERGFVPDGAWQKFERGVEPAGVSRTDLVIDEPSKPIPSSSAPSISLGVTAKLFRWPSMSVNHSSTNSTPSSSIRFSTSWRAAGSLVARFGVSTCVMNPS